MLKCIIVPTITDVTTTIFPNTTMYPTQILLSDATTDNCGISIYKIAWSVVVLGINCTSNAGSNFHEAKPSEISCQPCYHMLIL